MSKYGYVLGFLFNVSNQSVLLVKKNKPEFQKGLLNGIGGKIEEGETPLEAMKREFREETGISDELDWSHFLTYKFRNNKESFKMYCYKSFVFETPSFLRINDVGELNYEVQLNTLPLINNKMNNLNWIIPMAWCEHKTKCLMID